MDLPEPDKDAPYRSFGVGVWCYECDSAELQVALMSVERRLASYHYHCPACDAEGDWLDLAKRRRYYGKTNS